MAGEPESDDQKDHRVDGAEADLHSYEDFRFIPYSYRDHLSEVWSGNTAHRPRFGRRKTDMDYRRIVTRKLVVLAVTFSNFLLLAGDAFITRHFLTECL